MADGRGVQIKITGASRECAEGTIILDGRPIGGLIIRASRWLADAIDLIDVFPPKLGGELLDITPTDHRCGTCKWYFRHWRGTAETGTGEIEYLDYGECILMAGAEARDEHLELLAGLEDQWHKEPADELGRRAQAYADGYEWDSCGVYVHETFGCVEWEPRPE